MSSMEKAAGPNAGARGNPNGVPGSVAAGETMTFTFPDGTTRDYPKGSTVGNVVRDCSAPYPVVAALLDHKMASLERVLTYGGSIEPVHLGTRDGALIYRRSLCFLVIRAIQEIYPDLRVYVNHSLSGGYYVELQHGTLKNISTLTVTQGDLDKIKRRMREIVAADEPFVRKDLSLDEAVELFEKSGQLEKVQLLRCCDAERVSVYRCGGATNHFYGYLVPSTGFLKVFDLIPQSPGFVLLFPSISEPLTLPPFEPQPKLFAVYQEYERWMRILGLDTVAQLNDLVKRNKIREYILIAEGLQEKKIAALADKITNSPTHPRVVLISGPSASGKTTFVKRLSIQLRVNGFRPVSISMDDFFVDREETPKDESGDYDFESFETINIALFGQTILGLLRGDAVPMPRFDFPQGRRIDGGNGEMKIEPDQIILIEGIHALNDRLLTNVPEGLKYKIYVSPLTHLNIDEHNRIASSDARVLRRLVRDARYRGYSALETLGRWPSVRRGEEKNIFPYQENADVIFNSSLPYEISVLAPYAMKGLAQVERKSIEYAEAARLMRFLSYFKEIPADEVPKHSILREFIGGSRFKY